ncbi:MAG: hypothetical protein G01um101433_1060, partial [Parcubacteria group bacterium Gr01-1014_33]
FLFLVGGIFFGWRYIPKSIQERILALLPAHTAMQSQKGADVLRSAVIPKDPEERRSALIEELENEITKIEKEAETSARAGQDPSLAQNEKDALAASFEETRRIVGELKDNNKDASLLKKAAIRAFDRILPGAGEGEKCEVK